MAKNLLLILLLMLMGRIRCFALLARERSLALKWFWPARRAKILPFLVIFKRLVKDLCVLIMLLLLDYDREPFWSFYGLLGNLVIYSDELQDPFQTFFQKVEVHILGTAYEVKVDFDTIAFA